MLQSSSGRFLCCTTFVGLSQHASSKTAPLFSRATPVARELASIQTFMSYSSTHQTPQAWSFCFTLSIVFIIIHLRTVSSILLFHPFVIKVACRLMTLATTRSKPHTARCPTSFPHRQNASLRVISLGASGIVLSLFHLS